MSGPGSLCLCVHSQHASSPRIILTPRPLTPPEIGISPFAALLIDLARFHETYFVPSLNAAVEGHVPRHHHMTSLDVTSHDNNISRFTLLTPFPLPLHENRRAPNERADIALAPRPDPRR